MPKNKKVEPQTPKLPTLEDLLQTPDPAKQAEIVGELIQEIAALKRAKEHFLLITYEPRTKQVQVISDRGMSFQVALDALQQAQLAVMDSAVRQQAPKKETEVTPNSAEGVSMPVDAEPKPTQQ